MTDQNEFARKLGPQIAALVTACESLGFNITGFISNLNAEDVIRFGNIEHVQGVDFVRLNASLAWLCAMAASRGAEVSFQQPLGTSGQDPLEIADKLAMRVIMTPSDEVPGHISDLAREYADLRSAPNA